MRGYFLNRDNILWLVEEVVFVLYSRGGKNIWRI